jgi:hypothetical protein
MSHNISPRGWGGGVKTPTTLRTGWAHDMNGIAPGCKFPIWQSLEGKKDNSMLATGTCRKQFQFSLILHWLNEVHHSVLQQRYISIKYSSVPGIMYTCTPCTSTRLTSMGPLDASCFECKASCKWRASRLASNLSIEDGYDCDE